MNPYWLNFGRYNFSRRKYESFGHIIIELPINLKSLPDSNEVDMRAILSAEDMAMLGWEFGTSSKNPQPRFYFNQKRPGKFEYPGPPNFKTECGYEVWVTRKFRSIAF